ncbi:MULTISPECIES: recombinase family protein [unclassified Paraburkholderia]|uniref:recombinase family protein n=1 Tax=unclassified Paraburkholderia TaxID=2615204 RepID=UPI00288C3E94|nr:MULTISPECIES: recombinase family protein [unclassified Paraburkholderia]
MTRLFCYCRVSTVDQTTDNQVQEIEAAGFTVAKQRIITETVSGSVPGRRQLSWPVVDDCFGRW